MGIPFFPLHPQPHAVQSGWGCPFFGPSLAPSSLLCAATLVLTLVVVLVIGGGGGGAVVAVVNGLELSN